MWARKFHRLCELKFNSNTELIHQFVAFSNYTRLMSLFGTSFYVWYRIHNDSN